MSSISNSNILEIKREINSLIRFGMSKDAITTVITNNYKSFERDVLLMIVSDTIEANDNYEFIQKLMRSKIITDAEGKHADVLYDTKLNTTSLIDDKAIKAILHPKFDRGTLKVICNFSYRPYEDKVYWRELDQEMYTFNTYIPPKWYARKFYSMGDKRIYAPSSGMPNIYKKFFKHLTNNNKESYIYLLDWLANGLKSRNFCILTTIGKPGIGKGVLGNIMRELFGPSNFYSGSDRMFKGTFNAQLADKRLVYCDEVTIRNKEDEDRIKLVVNDYVEVEKKGIDATELRNYANFYISSNNFDSLKISGDDRRFSIIDLTDTKLPLVMKDAEIKSLTEEKNIAKLGRFLYTREVDAEKMKKVFASERTKLVRESSLYEWQDWFITEYCVENAGKSIKQRKVSDDVEDEFGSKFRPSRSSLEKLRDLLPPSQRVFDVKKKGASGRQQWTVIFKDREEMNEETN